MNTKRVGFTLVEVMIVVVIMAILAATVIPQFTSSSDDARNSTAEFNLHSLRSTVQLYKAEHRGKLPTDFTFLTESTDVSGSKSGSDYGPYLQEIPANPYNGLNTVEVITSGSADKNDSHGWVYNSATGEVWLDTDPSASEEEEEEEETPPA